MDITVVFDDADKLIKALERELTKYANLGFVIPIVVGGMGSWFPDNIFLRNELSISGQLLATFQSECSNEAIEGSGDLLQY